MESCPNDVITMDWVPCSGNRDVGLWRDTLPEAAAEPQRPRSWFLRLFARPTCQL
jgi:hypothetical protein